jgi:hypothetical protein
VGKTKRGKGTKLMARADRSSLPLAVHAASASPHEVTLVEATLAASSLGEEPERLIGTGPTTLTRWTQTSKKSGA